METNQWLLIDAGATKTEFSLLENGQEVFHFMGDGINPNYRTDEEIMKIFSLFLSYTTHTERICRIYYYGAGCAGIKNEQRMVSLIVSLFPSAMVRVYSDLMAACHALCQHKPAIVAILGTGSSSCLFDGEQITERAPSLGYLLGDEGSGTDLGKRLITCYLNEQLPDDLADQFETEQHITPEGAIHCLYRDADHPNEFFASLAPFVRTHIDHPFVYKMCFQSFDDFFTKQKKYYADKSSLVWQISGSVGFFFKQIILEVAANSGCTIGNVVSTPMHGLLDYYKSLK